MVPWGRMLSKKDRLLQEDSESETKLMTIPKNTLSKVILPPQYAFVEVAVYQGVDSFVTNLGNQTEIAAAATISISTFAKMPMKFIWGGINAIQIIAHLPMYEISFPAENTQFFAYLTQVVSFDIYEPTQKLDFWKITPT